MNCALPNLSEGRKDAVTATVSADPHNHVTNLNAPPGTSAEGPLTAYDIVQRLGGVHRVARECEVAVSTVGQWYRLGIPALRAMRVYEIAQADGAAEITLAAIMHSARHSCAQRRHATPASRSLSHG